MRSNLLFPSNLVVTAIVIGSMLSATSLLAQTTWDGGGDGQNWSDPANWDPDGVPAAETEVVLDSGAVVRLDVAAVTGALTLDQATIEGPSDLVVTGHLFWGAGTVTGDGILTITGGLTFGEGPDKIIGRQVEVESDAWFEHSDIYYDIDNGGAIHYHAGTTLTIVEEPAVAGGGPRANSDLHSLTLPSGETIRAGHREAPMSGFDPTADITDVYVVVIDGQVVSNTTVFRDVSTQVNGNYLQNTGSTAFGSGSQFTLVSNFVLGNASEVLFGAGTHLMQGPLTEEEIGTAMGARTLGSQTTFIMDTGFSSLVPFFTFGLHELTTDVSLQSLSVEAGQPTEIGGDATLTTEEFNLEAYLTVAQATIRTALANLFSANITLTSGATIDADEMVIDQDQSGLIIEGDLDPQELEDIRIREQLQLVRTGNPPLRVMVDVELGEGSETTISQDTEVQFFGDVNINGAVGMENGATWTTRDGRTFMNASGVIYELLVPGDSEAPLFAMEPDGTMSLVFMESSQIRDVDVRVEGKIEATGNNDFGNANVTVAGGTIEGDGETRARINFESDSSVERATIDGVTVAAKDGSSWKNGHIDLKNGAKLKVEPGAELTCIHTASGLSITDDGDPSEDEMVDCQGQITLDQAVGTGVIFDCPSRVDGEFSCLPNTKMTTRDPMEVFGTLRIGGNAECRCIFTTSTIHPGGTVTGDGGVVEALGGDLDLRGILVVGGSEDINWTGDLVASFVEDLMFSCPRTDGNQPGLTVTGNFGVPPTVTLAYDDQQDPGEVDFNLVEAGNFQGSVQNVEVEGSYTGATIEEQAPFLTATTTTAVNVSTLAGVVHVDLDEYEFLSDGDQRLVGVAVELQDVIGAVLASTMTDHTGTYNFQGEFSGELKIVVGDPSMENILLADPVTGVIGITIDPATELPNLNFRYVRDARILTVDSTEDSGPGTFRQAILDANADTENQYFNIDLNGVAGQTLSFTNRLPQLNRAMQVIGDPSLPFTGDASYTLDGSACADCDGLVLSGGGSVVRGITIQNFDGYGIVVETLGDNVILANDIIGNGAGGILIRSGFDNHVGSGNIASPNLITGNGGPGITVLDGERHALRSNEVFANAGQAIDLLGDGVTNNDARDLDDGPNDLQNTPVLTDQDPLGFNVSGTLESRPVADYIIEIYGSEFCPTEGTADLQQLLGVGLVTTDADGFVMFTIETEPFAGELSAVATDVDGSTSEASACFMSVVAGIESPTAPAFVCMAGPNPTKGPSFIRLALPSAQRVEVSIHDVTGRRVQDLLEADLESGSHELHWDGTDDRGRASSSGIYFYQVRAGERTASGRIVKVR